MGLAREVHDITRNLVLRCAVGTKKRRIAQLGFRRNECDLLISQHEQQGVLPAVFAITPSLP